MNLLLLLTLLLANPFVLKAADIEFDIDSDSQKWSLAYEGSVDNFSIVEYTTNNESISNWTRLASVVTYEGLSADPAELFMKMLQGMQTKFPESKISYRIHNGEASNLIGEWHLKGAKNSPDEHNWIKIIASDKNIHTLLFTTKNSDEVERVRPKWEQILKKSRLKETVSVSR